MVDLVLCLQCNEFPDLVVCPTCRHFQLLFFFFEFAANCCKLLFKSPQGRMTGLMRYWNVTDSPIPFFKKDVSSALLLPLLPAKGATVTLFDQWSGMTFIWTGFVKGSLLLFSHAFSGASWRLFDYWNMVWTSILSSAISNNAFPHSFEIKT